MDRKRWTPKEVVTETDLRFREKKKWQLALRRYVLEQNPSPMYAPYFGLPIASFRQWIETQFAPDMNWDNYATTWQFEHIVPVAYFDFTVETDLLLCWNFTNIGVGLTEKAHNGAKQADVLTARSYFAQLHRVSGLAQCQKMLEKIDRLQELDAAATAPQQAFIQQHLSEIETMATLNPDDFNQLNTGMKLVDVLLQRDILNKFG
jgi:hypothetical protein